MTTKDTVWKGVTVPHTHTKLQYGRYIWPFCYRGPLRTQCGPNVPRMNFLPLSY